MHLRCRRIGSALFASLSVLIASPPAGADDWLGVRGGYYFDQHRPFLGAESLTQVGHWPLFFNPNVEYVFTRNRKHITVNMDFEYESPRWRRTFLFAGFGPALVYDNPHGPIEPDVDIVSQVSGGVGREWRSIVPYLRGKVILQHDREAVLALGLRF